MSIRCVTYTLDVDMPCPSCGSAEIQWLCELSPEINFDVAHASDDFIIARAKRITEQCPRDNCGYAARRR